MYTFFVCSFGGRAFQLKFVSLRRRTNGQKQQIERNMQLYFGKSAETEPINDLVRIVKATNQFEVLKRRCVTVLLFYSRKERKDLGLYS